MLCPLEILLKPLQVHELLLLLLEMHLLPHRCCSVTPVLLRARGICGHMAVYDAHSHQLIGGDRVVLVRPPVKLLLFCACAGDHQVGVRCHGSHWLGTGRRGCLRRHTGARLPAAHPQCHRRTTPRPTRSRGKAILPTAGFFFLSLSFFSQSRLLCKCAAGL